MAAIRFTPWLFPVPGYPRTRTVPSLDIKDRPQFLSLHHRYWCSHVTLPPVNQDAKFWKKWQCNKNKKISRMQLTGNGIRVRPCGMIFVYKLLLIRDIYILIKHPYYCSLTFFSFWFLLWAGIKWNEFFRKFFETSRMLEWYQHFQIKD